MFVIWGWRTFLAIIGTGQFSCPACRGDAEYKHVRPRRWFTVFFLPVIPLEHLTPYVTCTRCSSTYTEAVLLRPTQGQLIYHYRLASRAAIAHLISLLPASAPSPDVAAAAAALLVRDAGVPTGYDRTAVDIDVTAFRTPDAVAPYVRPMAEHISLDGREIFLRRAATFAAGLTAANPAAVHAALSWYGELLDFSPAHSAGVLASVSSGPGGPQIGGAL